MKQQILNRLEMVQKRIRRMIAMVESNKSAPKIIPKIDSAQEELRNIERLILKCHILTVLAQTGLRKNKQQNLLKLCGF